MAKTLFVLSCIVALLAAVQADNANPNDSYEPFDSDNVWELSVDGDVVYNTLPTESTVHYFWFEMPNAPQVTITLESLNYTDGGCNTALGFTLNPAGMAWDSNWDYNVGFGCYNGPNEDNLCYYYSTSDYFYDTYEYTVGVDGNDWAYPGQMVFMTLQEDSIGYNCDYSISVSIDNDQTCDSNETPAYAGSDLLCETYDEIEESGDERSGTLSTDEYEIFMIDTPENAARVWVTIKSAVAQGWYIDYYPVGWVYDVNYESYDDEIDSQYVLYYQSRGPQYGKVYWVLKSNYDNADYSIQFNWEICEDEYTGIAGSVEPPTGTNDCQDDQLNAMDLPDDFPVTKTISDVSRTTTDSTWSGTLVTYDVPFGTYGWINVSCECSDMTTDSWIAFSTGQNMPYCDDDYLSWISCVDDGPEYNTILSHTLYGGPTLQMIMCTDSDTAVDFTLNIGGDVTLSEDNSATAAQVGLISLVALFALLF